MVEKRDYPENLDDFKGIMDWFDGLSDDEVAGAIREQIAREDRWIHDRRPDADEEMVPLLWDSLDTVKSDLHVNQKVDLEHISPRFESELNWGDDREKVLTPKRAALLLCPSAFIKAEDPEPDLNEKTVEQLKDLLREAGKTVSGKKAELIERLEE